VTQKHYSPWIRERRERLESHVRMTWADDPLLVPGQPHEKPN